LADPKRVLMYQPDHNRWFLLTNKRGPFLSVSLYFLALINNLVLRIRFLFPLQRHNLFYDRGHYLRFVSFKLVSSSFNYERYVRYENTVCGRNNLFLQYFFTDLACYTYSNIKLFALGLKRKHLFSISREAKINANSLSFRKISFR
jgi:hypothetical protein